jgi:DNA-directed RNA polymerase specialized sigma24 family protein
MAGLIKRILGIEQLERDSHTLFEYIRDLARYSEVLDQEDARIREAVRALEHDLSVARGEWEAHLAEVGVRLRALGEELDKKVSLTDLAPIVAQVKELLQLLQQRAEEAVALSCGTGCNGPPAPLQHLTDPARELHQLPPALRQVVTVLFDAEGPLSYGQIAKRIGKEPSTARSYIHRLRERGFPIDSHGGFGMRKAVSLPLAIRRQLAIPGPG